MAMSLESLFVFIVIPNFPAQSPFFTKEILI